MGGWMDGGMEGWRDGWMIRWIDRSRFARYIYISATPAPLHVCSANRTQMYMYQGAVSGEDVYIREGMAALAGWQGAACTASS